MSIVPNDLRDALRRAGWFEGRRVTVHTSVSVDHPAYAVLAELGDLIFPNPSPSVTSIAFRYDKDAKEWMAAWEAALAMDLVSIAEQDDGHAALYLTDRGHMIGCSLVHPACFLVGQTFGKALQAIWSGERARPMLLPDEEEVILYGNRFRRGDPVVIGPDAFV